MALQATHLRERRDDLALYLEYLPVLELRKQQLERAVRGVESELETLVHEQEEHLESARNWAGLARFELNRLGELRAATVRRGTKSLAGLTVPHLEGVDFPPTEVSLLATPPLVDTALEWRQRGITLREQVVVLEEQRSLIEQEKLRTTQRINLYEQVLIPEARAQIRRIRRHLGDQLTAAVCRAKIAKAKLVARQRGKEESHGRR